MKERLESPVAWLRDKVGNALKGKPKALTRLIHLRVDVNAPCPDLYSHAPTLHHAVGSRSLEAEDPGGGRRGFERKGHSYQGTPLGWAEYGKWEEIAA